MSFPEPAPDPVIDASIYKQENTKKKLYFLSFMSREFDLFCFLQKTHANVPTVSKTQKTFRKSLSFLSSCLPLKKLVGSGAGSVTGNHWSGSAAPDPTKTLPIGTMVFLNCKHSRCMVGIYIQSILSDQHSSGTRNTLHD